MLREVLEALPAPKGNLLSYVVREAEDVAGLLPAVVNDPQLLWGLSASCSRSMPESFHGFLYPDSRDSILTRDALDALLDACLKREPEPGVLVPPFLRRSRKEEKDEMLPGLRSLSKMERCSVSSNCERVGDSVERGGSARWRSLESK